MAVSKMIPLIEVQCLHIISSLRSKQVISVNDANTLYYENLERIMERLELLLYNTRWRVSWKRVRRRREVVFRRRSPCSSLVISTKIQR